LVKLCVQYNHRYAYLRLIYFRLDRKLNVLQYRGVERREINAIKFLKVFDKHSPITYFKRILFDFVALLWYL